MALDAQPRVRSLNRLCTIWPSRRIMWFCGSCLNGRLHFSRKQPLSIHGSSKAASETQQDMSWCQFRVRSQCLFWGSRFLSSLFSSHDLRFLTSSPVLPDSGPPRVFHWASGFWCFEVTVDPTSFSFSVNSRLGEHPRLLLGYDFLIFLRVMLSFHTSRTCP